MVLIHIHTNNFEISKEITSFLLKENMILKSFIVKETYESSTSENSYMIICKTKALLFDTIDKLLKLKFNNKYQDIYAMPIVNMNWEQSQELKSKINGNSNPLL